MNQIKLFFACCCIALPTLVLGAVDYGDTEKEAVERDIRSLVEAYDVIASDYVMRHVIYYDDYPAKIMENLSAIKKNLDSIKDNFFTETFPYEATDAPKPLIVLCRMIEKHKDLLCHDHTAPIVRIQRAIAKHKHIKYSFNSLVDNNLEPYLDCFSNNLLTHLLWYSSLSCAQLLPLQETLLRCGANTTFKRHTNKDLWDIVNAPHATEPSRWYNFNHERNKAPLYEQQSVRVMRNALLMGNIPLAQLLIDTGEREYLNRPVYDGKPALFFVLYQGRLKKIEMIEFLLNAGAEVNVRMQTGIERNGFLPAYLITCVMKKSVLFDEKIFNMVLQRTPSAIQLCESKRILAETGKIHLPIMMRSLDNLLRGRHEAIKGLFGRILLRNTAMREPFLADYIASFITNVTEVKKPRHYRAPASIQQEPLTQDNCCQPCTLL